MAGGSRCLSNGASSSSNSAAQGAQVGAQPVMEDDYACACSACRRCECVSVNMIAGLTKGMRAFEVCLPF
eukprot:scaffold18923_cov21-Tisochrysis_lutea.AAC.3